MFEPLLDTLNGKHLFLECHVSDYHNLCRLDGFLFSNAIVVSSSGASVNITSVSPCSSVYFCL